jgi:hypothetical protein
MPFISENELERALVKAVKNPASAPDFYRLLLESDLLVLGTAQGQEDAQESFTAAPGASFNLVTSTNAGGPYLPIFSSLPRMQEYVKDESKFLRINGRGLLDMTRGAPVILNPASEYGKEFTAEQIALLLDGQTSRGEQRIIMGEADYPMALVEALVALFSSRPDIATAWMIQVTFADRAREPHPLVGIELDPGAPGDWPQLMQAIQAAADAAVPGMVFDVQRVDRASPTGLTSALLQAAPFYQGGISAVGNPTLN